MSQEPITTAPSKILINRSTSIQLIPSPSTTGVSLFLRKAEYDLALKSLDEAVKLDPDYAGAFANRARA